MRCGRYGFAIGGGFELALAGDVVSIRSGVLEIREKVIRFFHEMHNDETGEIAATTELTGVHLDTTLRKSCPFPVQTLERARGLILPA